MVTVEVLTSPLRFEKPKSCSYSSVSSGQAGTGLVLLPRVSGLCEWLHVYTALIMWYVIFKAEENIVKNSVLNKIYAYTFFSEFNSLTLHLSESVIFSVAFVQVGYRMFYRQCRSLK